MAVQTLELMVAQYVIDRFKTFLQSIVLCLVHADADGSRIVEASVKCNVFHNGSKLVNGQRTGRKPRPPSYAHERGHIGLAQAVFGADSLDASAIGLDSLGTVFGNIPIPVLGEVVPLHTT